MKDKFSDYFLENLSFFVILLFIIYNNTSNSLFTPYGYKFEGEDGLRRVREVYDTTLILEAQKSPWGFADAGHVILDSQSLELSNSTGSYWASSVENTSGSKYYLGMYLWGLYPSRYDDSWYGFSVG